jgi:hypothetical protein
MPKPAKAVFSALNSSNRGMTKSSPPSATPGRGRRGPSQVGIARYGHGAGHAGAYRGRPWHAHDLPADAFAASRSLQFPGFSVAVGEMAAAVRRSGGEAARIRCTRFADPADHFWPRVLQARRAEALGFAADTGMDEAVQAFIEDDLEMQKQLVQRSR